MNKWNWYFSFPAFVSEIDCFIFLTADLNASFKKESYGFWCLFVICGICLLDFGIYKEPDTYV